MTVSDPKAKLKMLAVIFLCVMLGRTFGFDFYSWVKYDLVGLERRWVPGYILE